jgi:hypothetical protein
MNVNLDTFNRQLAGLSGRFADLGAKLAEAAREMQNGGAPPAEALVEALAAARAEFVELLAEIVAAAESLGVAVPDHVESAKSLEPVLAAMVAATDARRRRAAFDEIRGRILAIYDRIAAIRHEGDETFAPLVALQNSAKEAKAAALALTEATTDQARALMEAAGPFADLLTMLESTEALDDEKFSALEESVSTAFGRPIAVAVGRGRLLLPGQTPRAPEPESPPEPVRMADAMRVSEPVRAPEPSVPPPRAPEPIVTPPPPREPRRPVEEKLERVPAAHHEPPATPQPAAPHGEPSAPDETAQWWLAAWARWSGWKNTLAYPEAVREELAKYPYLLSVPIQQSPEFEEGLLAYGYSIIMEHVEKQKPGSVGNALNNLKTGQTKPVGTQLYEYLVTEGRLTETYPDFLKSVLLAAVPEPGPWVQARIIHSKDDTRVFQRPTPRLGETEQTAKRFLAENQRFTEHKFSASLPPLTSRFFLIQAELKDAHGVDVKLKIDGAPSDTGLVVTVPAAGKATKVEARRLSAEGTALPGIGRDYGAVWFAVFNADSTRETQFQLSLTLRKDVRGMKK